MKKQLEDRTNILKAELEENKRAADEAIENQDQEKLNKLFKEYDKIFNNLLIAQQKLIIGGNEMLKLIEKDHGAEKELFEGELIDIVQYLQANENLINWVLDEDPGIELPNLENIKTLKDLEIELEKINLDWWQLEVKKIEELEEVEKANYKELTSKLEELQGDFNGHKFDVPVTVAEFEELLNITVNQKQFDRNRQSNEYDTQDINIEIETDEDITIILALEVDDNDMITHIDGVDEY